MKRFTALVLSILMVLAMASFASAEATVPTFDGFTLGEDYKDITATIKMLTHRTDLKDNGALDAYVAEFNKMYPNITVEYEAITDYAQESLIRLTGSDDWGDIMMLPAVEVDELSTYFTPFGTVDAMKDTYNFIDNKQFEGTVYGIPSTGNANGLLYNKRIFQEAGVTELPKTPEEYIAALKLVKENTDAIPLYTNYAAGWTMGAWDAYITATIGTSTYMNQDLVHTANPFVTPGPADVYGILYTAVKEGLIEDDYTTTDWETSKGMLNRGEIASMVLGSWAYSQMQQADSHPEDVGYMAFPVVALDGKQYAPSGADYCYAINCKADVNQQIAAMVYVKWLTYESGFAFNEGGIAIVKGAPLPDLYAAFDGVAFLTDDVALPGEDTYRDLLNSESTLMINNGGNTKIQQIVEAAFTGSKTFEDIMTEWNTLWADAMEAEGIEAK